MTSSIPSRFQPGMLQLDFVLPSQYWGSRRKQAPEHRLMIAVLHNAIDCLQKPRPQRLFNEAKQWFLADETDWPYSFQRICEALDLDADAVREHLVVAPAFPARNRHSEARPSGNRRGNVATPNVGVTGRYPWQPASSGGTGSVSS